MHVAALRKKLNEVEARPADLERARHRLSSRRTIGASGTTRSRANPQAVKSLVLRIACAAARACRCCRSARAPATVSYAPPAGNLPAGHYHGLPYNAILPSGRLVTPAGTQRRHGHEHARASRSRPMAATRSRATTPKTKPACAARSIRDASGGYSLTVVDTARMIARRRTIARRTKRSSAGSPRCAIPSDPRANARASPPAARRTRCTSSTLDAAGRLVRRTRAHAIAIPGSDRSRRSPIAASAFRRRCSRRATAGASTSSTSGGDSVAAIDVATRRLLGAAAARRLLSRSAPRSPVAAAGDQRRPDALRRCRAPAADAAVRSPPADRARIVALVGRARCRRRARRRRPRRCRWIPHPTACARSAARIRPRSSTTADGSYAFVAMTNVDRIATVALGAAPHVVGGVELRLFDRGPYGTQPTALALSRDGSRLYVALTGLNAVAVIDARDPLHLHRLGLIPTGWAPSALALVADDRTLFVANAKGFRTRRRLRRRSVHRRRCARRVVDAAAHRSGRREARRHDARDARPRRAASSPMPAAVCRRRSATSC